MGLKFISSISVGDAQSEAGSVNGLAEGALNTTANESQQTIVNAELPAREPDLEDEQQFQPPQRPQAAQNDSLERRLQMPRRQSLRLTKGIPPKRFGYND
jgi:hypothetical protein